MLHRLLAAAAVIAATAAVSAQEWTPGGTKNGIELAFRDDPALGAREVRATAELPYSESRIAAVVCDFTQPLDPDVRDARIVSGNLDSEYSIYLRYAPRFLVVAARDVVIAVRRQADGCSWSEQAGVVEKRPGTVRMPLLRGAWVIEPLAADRARVVYQVAVRPGGRIPRWMVRRGAASALPDVITRVTRCLARTSAAGERCPSQ